MAEEEESNATPVEIRLPPELFGGVWSNFAVVTHSPYEFTIDFIRLDPQRNQGQVTSRVNLSPLFVTQLLEALQDNWNKYAQKALPKEAQDDAAGA